MYVDQGTSKNTKKEHPLQLISSGLQTLDLVRQLSNIDACDMHGEMVGYVLSSSDSACYYGGC